jgi:dihydrodipicolinate synthase/N-acetylneuraminate lyase
VDWHVAEGTDCIGVVVGTTGEPPTVTLKSTAKLHLEARRASQRRPLRC